MRLSCQHTSGIFCACCLSLLLCCNALPLRVSTISEVWYTSVFLSSQAD